VSSYAVSSILSFICLFRIAIFSSSFDFYLASYYSCSCRTEKCRKHVKVLLEEGGAQGKAVWFGGKKVI